MICEQTENSTLMEIVKFKQALKLILIRAQLMIFFAK